METTEYLKNYYEGYNEDERLLSKHGRVEFITTMKYIEKYLSDGCKILEIGAASGRYSHTLAQMGYKVDAVELIEHNIEVFKSNTKDGEDISITQGNATDLSMFESDSYDITLLLGPMYHLYNEDDKLKALSEAVRVTKKNGVILVAYCMSDPAILSFGFIKGNISKLIENNMLDIDTFKAISKPCDLFEMCRTEDIDRLRSNFNVTQLHYVATDGYTRHMSQTVDEMDDDTYNLYLKYHLTVCERSDLIGLSNHTLDIFRKE